MHLISSLLFAISANIDSFIVGMSYGIKKSNIDLLKSTVISLVTLTGTVIAILMGTQISQFLPASSTQAIGCALLIGLGLYYIIKSFFSYIREKIKKAEVKSNECGSGTQNNVPAKASLLTMKEGLFLGLALSINNFGMGIGASITGLKLLPTAVMSLVVSVIFLYAGNLIGKTKVPHISDQSADFISGLILAALGIYELLA
ncbi:manganese efflux pump [Muricomes sp. OA1]|uniref:Sporulation membrane protein YtaF n=2 Tax=Lachnospiraceae TaxID=186803 RepID=A0A3E2WVJ7_9FIRM|nr:MULTISPECIES: manganese efflux pump [Clostridia]MBS6765227.1 manganese efflux pump [Clostridium sp.]MCH1973451.1 manganese efflux pump [Muricomes sp. OA1]MDU7706047.1 manganese efflux pump [Clostridium sp.]MRM87038.1 sporulation membrane protein YtaF [Faecalicatena contorta]MSC83242.1 sporulation membrane protein YtaF [Eubacterium sp. BIOML-A1]